MPHAGSRSRREPRSCPTDLARGGLDAALSRSAFEPNEPAFFAWLGVTMYLDREASLTTLRAIARCSAPGSELVFTYIDHDALLEHSNPGLRSFGALRQTVASIGEPFVSVFDPQRLAETLRETGLDLVEDLDTGQLVGRYDPFDANRLRGGTRGHLARARVNGDTSPSIP